MITIITVSCELIKTLVLSLVWLENFGLSLVKIIKIKNLTKTNFFDIFLIWPGTTIKFFFPIIYVYPLSFEERQYFPPRFIGIVIFKVTNLINV